jgi:hypothetical protein
VSVFRQRSKQYVDFFSEEGNLAYCNNIRGLMTVLFGDNNAEEWRLFIDGSSMSLKAVLLHIGNKKPSVPIAYGRDLKETYANMVLLLDKIEYDSYQWAISGDFKIIGILLGLQSGFTKYGCFLCEWDSRDRSNHYKQKKWPKRCGLVPGKKNVKYSNLVDPSKILLPPLHIKLGLMKQFVKALKKDEGGMTYLKTKFPKLSEAKINAGVFIGN